jgi:hypothetical protein
LRHKRDVMPTLDSKHPATKDCKKYTYNVAFHV